VAELVNELQQRIDGDSKIGSLGVDVSWVDSGNGTSQLVLTNASYGSKSTISIDTTVTSSAAVAVGLRLGSRQRAGRPGTITAKLPPAPAVSGR